MSIDKAALLARRIGERDVPIAGLGSVRVRGLSRAESRDIANFGDDEREAQIIAMGLVDPQMTVDEVQQWMAGAPAGEFEPVSQAIGELSGLLEDSAKAAYKSDGEQPGA